MKLNDVLQKIAVKLRGASASDGDIQLLKSRLPRALVPDWFIQLVTDYKLAGACFSLNKEDDDSKLGAKIIWLSAEQIVSEAIDVEPGISVLSSGFLPIGACGLGSGDPYFLDLRRSSNDPPLVRIPHDYAAIHPYPLERVEVVTPTLADFFSKAGPCGALT